MIIGIDLGTSNSMAAVYKDGDVQLIPSCAGGVTTPSVVALDEAGVFHAGKVAKEMSLKESAITAQRFKRSMGTNAEYELGKHKLKPEELSAIILKVIKEDACDFLKEEVTEAIISVPAFFNNHQREAVLKAGKLAGFNVRKIINEPTAAAMAYGMGNVDNEEEKAIIVLDLGGGTFDISIMAVTGAVMEVVAVCGDNKLGGNDFTDKLVAKFMLDNKLHTDMSTEDNNLIWKAAEKAKFDLSESGEAEMECVIKNNRYSMKITEEEYTYLCFDLLEKIRHLTIRAIDESEYLPEEISDVVLVGGGTKLSIVKKMMEKMIGKELEYKINPDEAVVRGAAMQCAIMENNGDFKELVMTDICPYYIIEKETAWNGDEEIMSPHIFIEKNTTIPTKITYSSKYLSGIRKVVLYQSEDKNGINATKIGECKCIIPELEDRGCDMDQTLYYDINGIIRYEAYIPATNKIFKATMSSNGTEIETDKLIEVMDINVSSGENEANNLLIAEADNLYAEFIGTDRKIIAGAIEEFEAALKTNKKAIIKNARAKLENLIKEYKG